MAHALQVENLAYRITILGRGMAPVTTDRRPGVAEAFFIRIAVLRDDRSDTFWACHREAKTGGRTVVENIESITLQVQGVGESEESFGERVEGVFVVTLGGNIRETEARQIRRDDVITVGEAGDQFAELKGRGGEAVQQKNDRRIFWSAFTVEDRYAIGGDAVVESARDEGAFGTACVREAA